MSRVKDGAGAGEKGLPISHFLSLTTMTRKKLSRSYSTKGNRSAGHKSGRDEGGILKRGLFQQNNTKRGKHRDGEKRQEGEEKSFTSFARHPRWQVSQVVSLFSGTIARRRKRPKRDG